MPFPTHRLAVTALGSLQVDAELSPLVKRTFSIHPSELNGDYGMTNGVANPNTNGDTAEDGGLTWLRTEYRATTNRMLRVAVNGFMESLGVVLGVMEELDVDILMEDATRPTR